MSDRGDTVRNKRVEVGRIRMDSVNLPDLFTKLGDYMLAYGVDLDFGVDGPWFIITGAHTHLSDTERTMVGLRLVQDLTNKALRR